MEARVNANRSKAVSREMIANGRVKVTEWRFAPGAETGWHRHAWDYVVVPMTTGRLLLEEKNGSRVAELKAGEPYAREVGVEHNVVNANAHEFVFIEVELLG
jgi:quercetin dioxygenase-like cupin family protein